MEPTHVEIGRACQRVLGEVYDASGRRAGVAVRCDAIRARVALSDELWARASADLRHGGLACHDGDDAHLTLTAIGAARAAIDANARQSNAA